MPDITSYLPLNKILAQKLIDISGRGYTQVGIENIVKEIATRYPKQRWVSSYYVALYVARLLQRQDDRNVEYFNSKEYNVELPRFPKDITKKELFEKIRKDPNNKQLYRLYHSILSESCPGNAFILLEETTHVIERPRSKHFYTSLIFRSYHNIPICQKQKIESVAKRIFGVKTWCFFLKPLGDNSTALWKKIRLKLLKIYGEEIDEEWLSKCNAFLIEGLYYNHVQIRAPTNLVMNYVRDNYEQSIVKILRELTHKKQIPKLGYELIIWKHDEIEIQEGVGG